MKIREEAIILGPAIGLGAIRICRRCLVSGHCDNSDILCALMKVFVLPSVYDGTSMVILEAAALDERWWQNRVASEVPLWESNATELPSQFRSSQVCY